jgi:FAD-dependent urate hydroxylase
VTDAAECGTELRLTTPAGTIMVDDLILGTGFRFDLFAAPELAGMAGTIATWRDRAAGIAVPPEHEFWDLPYLGPDFAFLEKRPGTAPHLAGLTCFNHAAFLSLGYIGGDIPACSDGARRLADGIARSLFLEDAAWHEAGIHAFTEQELTGDEFAGRLA